MHTLTDNVGITRLVLLMPTAESSLSHLNVTDCFICSESFKQCPLRQRADNGGLMPTLPHDRSVRLGSDEVCACSQIHTAGRGAQTLVHCVFVCVQMVSSPRHSPCCTWMCVGDPAIHKTRQNMRDKCKHQSSFERESDGERKLLLREGWEHAEVGKVLNVIVSCPLRGISSHG